METAELHFSLRPSIEPDSESSKRTNRYNAHKPDRTRVGESGSTANEILSTVVTREKQRAVCLVDAPISWPDRESYSENHSAR
jgi:hypothetical protein